MPRRVFKRTVKTRLRARRKAVKRIKKALRAPRNNPPSKNVERDGKIFRLAFQKVLLKNARVSDKGFIGDYRKKGYIKFSPNGKIVAGAKLKAIAKTLSKKKAFFLVRVEGYYLDKKGRRKKIKELPVVQQLVHRRKRQSFRSFVDDSLAYSLVQISDDTLSRPRLSWTKSPLLKFIERTGRKPKAKRVYVSITLEGHKK